MITGFIALFLLRYLKFPYFSLPYLLQKTTLVYLHILPAIHFHTCPQHIYLRSRLISRNLLSKSQNLTVCVLFSSSPSRTPTPPEHHSQHRSTNNPPSQPKYHTSNIELNLAEKIQLRDITHWLLFHRDQDSLSSVLFHLSFAPSLPYRDTHNRYALSSVFCALCTLCCCCSFQLWSCMYLTFLSSPHLCPSPPPCSRSVSSRSCILIRLL